MNEPVTRRRTLGLTTAAVGTVLLAGCTEDGGGDDGMGDGGDDGTNGGDGDMTDGGDGDGGDGGSGDVEAWQDVDEVLLDGYTEGWEGVEPAPIEGETNPTLVLIEGNEYTVGFENADGAAHDLVLWDENEEAVEGTDIIQAEGDTASITFEATQEMAQYVCTVHPDQMLGDVQVESGDAGDGGTDDGAGGNGTDDGTGTDGTGGGTDDTDNGTDGGGGTDDGTESGA